MKATLLLLHASKHSSKWQRKHHPHPKTSDVSLVRVLVCLLRNN
jgi:hypothetical protein